jgi:outer membrane biogenesis lipoprotein LolB
MKSNRRHSGLFLAIIAGLCLAGCAHRVPLEPTGLAPSAFWKDQAVRRIQLKRISGRLSLHYEGKKESVTGKGNVVADLPGRMRIELRDPLGRMQYMALLSESRLLAYYPSEKTVYTDSSGGKNYLRHFLGMQLSFDDLQQLFFGILPYSGSGELKGWSWNSTDGTYEATFTAGNRTFTLSVDGKLAALRRLTIESPGQQVAVEYTDFKTCCDVKVVPRDAPALAREVAVIHEKSKSRIELDWKEIKPLDAGALSGPVFHFDVPAGVEKVPLEG